MIIVGKWAEPKPGCEDRYYIAMRHRYIASCLLMRVPSWRPWLYRRVFRLWADAVNRMKIYGQDRVQHVRSSTGAGSARC
jgi:hypothetical protein